MDEPRTGMAGNGACEECLELIERAVLEGDGILRDAPASVRAHIDACPDCRAMENAIALLREIPDASDDLASRAATEYFARKRTKRARLVVGLPVAAALAAAAAVLFMLATPSVDRPTFDEDDMELQVVMGKPIVAGNEVEPGEDIVEGQEVSTGAQTALAKVSSKLSIGIAGNTKLALKSLKKDRVRINLERGHVAVRLAKRSGVDLVVDAKTARVIVTGTVFSVERLDGEVNVSVVQGTVRVESDEWPGESVEVAEGSSLAVKTRKSNPVETKSEQSIFSLLGMKADEERASSTLSSDAEDVLPKKDEGELQEAPAEIEQDAVEEKPEDSARGSARIEAEERRAEREVDDFGSPEPAETSGDLIRAARQCRNTRDWRCAASAYEKVINLYPNSAESTTVLVPLAQIELEYLKRPGSAIKHYDHYLRLLPRGPLAQEALYGKCRAFSSMGETDEEMEALEEFLSKYPKSVYAPNARARLEKLKAL